jgi:uncharacterized repeat protein (TIGR03803 family)
LSETRNILTHLHGYVTALPLSAVALIICGASSAAAAGHGFSVLYNFADAGDGGYPFAGVIKDSTGNLYGTTFYYNGTSTPGDVFKVAPDGSETVLYHFTAGNDGGYPNADLIQDKAGNLYGTTPYGGTNGDGVVFQLAPNGTETVIHSFSGAEDGGVPRDGVISDSRGNLYGTAAGGCCGIVYKLSQNGAETVLHSFKGGTDGGVPSAGVIEDKAGNLYGTTYLGGGTGCGDACGTVYKLAPNGTETLLHTFCSLANCSDGEFPETGLVQDRAGNLYGTTSEGGAVGCNFINGCGTVFKLTPDGVETVLHSFTGGTDGGSPNGLFQDTRREKGYLYGTAQNGGASGAGTVFKVKK